LLVVSHADDRVRVARPDARCIRMTAAASD